MKSKLTLVAVIFGVAVFSAGCAPTTIPIGVVPGQASPGLSGQLNSGVLSIPTKGQSGPVTVDAGWLANYNALIGIYGNQFHPALKRDDGISTATDGTITVDRAHFRQYALMVHWDNSRITF